MHAVPKLPPKLPPELPPEVPSTIYEQEDVSSTILTGVGGKYVEHNTAIILYASIS